MAKQSEDREDLFRDGRAMPVRGRTWIDGLEVVVGFRTGGQASLYWDQDPVFQFNAAGELRRLFFAGHRYAAQQRVLMRLGQDVPQSTEPESVSLQYVPVWESEIQEITQRWNVIRDRLRSRLESPPNDEGASDEEGACGKPGVGWDVLGTSHDDFVDRCGRWLDLNQDELKVAMTPNVG